MVTGLFAHRRFLDRERVRAAILAVERTTSAPVHVSLAPYFWGDVYRTAQRAFKRLRLDCTEERNGVLFFIVPSRRRFAVFGDTGAHEKIGQEIWDHVARIMGEALRGGEDPAEGVIQGIEELGRHLAKHFPLKEIPT
jgi:uncharacterized membrane protein